MLKQLTKEELLALFDPEVHPQIEAQMQRPGVTAIVVFENMQMDSSSFGARTALIVGEPYTYKSAEECDGKWLNDLPSQRQYATAVYPIPNPACGGVVR